MNEKVQCPKCGEMVLSPIVNGGSTCEIWRRYVRLADAYTILLDGARQTYNAIQAGIERPDQASRANALLLEAITAARMARGNEAD